MSQDRPHLRAHAATVSGDGVPWLHTVTFRGVLGDGTPWFCVDTRARTAEHLDVALPHLALLVLFDATGQQFRLTGRGAVHGAHAEAPFSTVRASAWATMPEAERLPFVLPAPGQPLVEVEPRVPPEEPPRSFAIASLTASEVDWFVEGPPPRRASFRLVGATWVTQWLNP